MITDPLAIAGMVAYKFIPFLFALCFHEYAHGWVAKLRGDNTAEMMGRLTMNPLVHMDLIGTFILPILAIIMPGMLFFGWAKPVPVNARNLKNPTVDMFWIALAGPLSNVFLALVATFGIWSLKHFFTGFAYFQATAQLLAMFMGVNLFLAFFNLIPLHPLDGGKVLARFLPKQLNYKLEQNEHITSMILLALFMFGAIRFLAIPVEIAYELLMRLALG